MTYRIPVVQIQMVRERTLASEVKQIRCAEDAAEILHLYLVGADREHFVVMVLDTKHNVRAIHTASIGTLDASIVHPREILKVALLANAAGILLGHNHPSGNPEASLEDQAVTKQLAAACKLMGIDWVDHIILGEGQFVSLKA